jgi:hypothetical protein
MPLSAGQGEAQGIAQGIHTGVDFRTEAAPATSQCLGSLTTVLLERTSGTGMSTDDRAVNKQILHVRIIDEMLVHLFPDFVIAPSCISFVDTVPFAIRRWQQSPLGTASGDPEHSFDKPSAVGFLANIGSWTRVQKR